MYHTEWRQPVAVSGGELEGGTCVCSLIVVPPPAAYPLPPQCPSSLPLSVSPPSSVREALAIKRGVETSVVVTLSSVAPAMSSGGVLVSSWCPCMMVWIAPLLIDI